MNSGKSTSNEVKWLLTPIRKDQRGSSSNITSGQLRILFNGTGPSAYPVVLSMYSLAAVCQSDLKAGYASGSESLLYPHTGQKAMKAPQRT